MENLLEVFENIIKSPVKTNGEQNFYCIEESKFKAIYELLKRESRENKK